MRHFAILLDIDGVLETTPAWRTAELAADGFLKFNERATANLQRILAVQPLEIVLTSTHRISYPVSAWKQLLADRGIRPAQFSKVDDTSTIADMSSRAVEIQNWISTQEADIAYVVIDDDLSLHGLPPEIKARCVITKPMIGLDEVATRRVIELLK